MTQYINGGKCIKDGYIQKLSKTDLIELLDKTIIENSLLKQKLNISSEVDTMPSFAGFNGSGGKLCPICHSNKDTETVLVPMSDTARDGIVECRQVHKECYKLFLRMNS